MNNNDAATLYYKSKEVPWTSGAGTAVFKNSFIPARGPNGGMLMIRNLALHATLNITPTVATLQGEDRYRAFRTVDLKAVGGVKRLDGISGDALRLISYAHLGAQGTHEHQDMAAGGGAADYKFTAVVPLSKPWAYDPDDTALPSDFFEELRVGMALGTDMSLGATIVVNSGTYYVIAECYESMAVVLPAQDVWRQVDLATTASLDGEIDTGGRLQDLYIYVPGANGGQTLANLTEAGIQHLMDFRLLKDPDLKHAYSRARGAATNLFSTKGNPLRTDPFVASDSGTLRALAVKITTGSKVWDGPEHTKETLKLAISAALPAAGRIIARFTIPKSEAQRAIIMRNHDKNASYYKTRDKSRRDLATWPESLGRYIPEKFFKVNGKGQRVG